MYFRARILKKTIVIFEISTLKFVQNESLTHTVNFGIESAFSKGPGPGPGLLYQVCRLLSLVMTPHQANLTLKRSVL